MKKIVSFSVFITALSLGAYCGMLLAEYVRNDIRKKECEWQEISRDTITIEEAQQYDTMPRRYIIVFE